MLRRSEAQADGWCRENPKKCASRRRASGLRIATVTSLDTISRNYLLSSAVASCVATAEARFFDAGKENGAFCAETDRKAAQRAVPVGERSELTGIESRDVLKYVSSKKRQMTPPAPKRLVLTDNHDK